MTGVCPFSAPFSKIKNAVTPVNAEITAFIDSIVAFCPKIVKYLPLFSIEQMILIYRAFRQAIF